MEEINSKKTEAFLTAIKTLADEECKSIDEETDRLRVERLRALQEEAEDRYKSYTEYETARIKADCNSAVSECEERSRKELTDLRAELCKKVYVIHRRNEFRGEQRLCEELKSFHNIEFLLNSEIKKINGKTRLESVLVKNNLSSEETVLPLDGLFVAIGKEPQNEIFAEVTELDENGYIKADESCKTSTDGIYAAGDCRTKAFRQLTTAAADGTVAALSP